MSGNDLPNNPDQEVPGYPEIAANLLATYRLPNGIGFGGGPSFREGFWLNYQHTLRAPSVILWNANVFYESENWDLMLRVENLTDEDWIQGSDGAFASNTLVTPGEPLAVRFSATYKW